MMETMETTESMDNVGLGLEPKWLRVTYTSDYSRNKEQADDKSNHNEKPFPRDFDVCDTMALDVNIGGLKSGWNKQNLSSGYLDDASALFETVLSHDFCAVLRYDVLAGDEINVAGATDRNCLAMLISVLQSFSFILKFAYLKHYVSPEIDGKKNDYKKTHEQFVKCVKIGVLEHLIYGAEIANPTKTKSSEYGVELINLKEYINYTKENQNDMEIEDINGENSTPEFLRFAEDIVGSKDHTFSDAAAFRSDMPGVVTSNMCPVTIGHETDCDKITAVEYRKDSGRVGSFRSFKNDFQNSVDFPCPKDGMVVAKRSLRQTKTQ